MQQQKVNEQLVIEFAQRVSQRHVRPDTIALTIEEARELTQLYPVPVILFAFSRCGDVIKNHRNIEPSKVKQTLHRLADKSLSEAHVKGKNLQHKGSTVTAPVTNGPPEEHVQSIRQLFQDSCTDGTWCLTEMEVQGLLKQHDIETLRQVFSEISQTFAEEQAQECLDLVTWKLEQHQLMEAQQ